MTVGQFIAKIYGFGGPQAPKLTKLDLSLIASEFALMSIIHDINISGISLFNLTETNPNIEMEEL